MTNPYEPVLLVSNPRTSFLGQPWFVCAIASVVAMPIWFFGLIAIVDAIKPIDNPAGLPIYAMMCLTLSIFVLPVNTNVVSPILAKLAYSSLAGATIVHVVVGTAAFGLLWFWPTAVGKIPSLSWTIIPYYLSVFWLPPMLVGSIAYSLRYVALNRRVV